jgi:hypothetical protein
MSFLDPFYPKIKHVDFNKLIHPANRRVLIIIICMGDEKRCYFTKKIKYDIYFLKKVY